MENLEKFFEDIFTKKVSYKIPARGKEWLVRLAPWLLIVFVVLSLWILITIPTSVYFPLQILLIATAFPGLKNRKKIGWKILYYSMLIDLIIGVLIYRYDMIAIIGSLIGVQTPFLRQDVGGIISLLIFFAIGLYLLFQIKDFYKETGIPGTLAEKIDEKVGQVTKKIG